MSKQKSHKNRKLEDHIGREFDLIETNVKDAPVKDVHWQGKELQTESDVHLEDDEGYGNATIIRCFTFGANPEAFAQHKPTKQELFNSHLKGIEVMLWKDGLKVMTSVTPRLVISKSKKFYQIFVGAEPAKGHNLYQTPQKLADIAHGRKSN